MPALTVWTKGDGLLSVVAPIGLAAAAPTALVVDLDPNGPVLPGAGTLAGLASSGPRRDDLRPTSEGTALLANGGIDPTGAEPLVNALLHGWPFVVLRSHIDQGLFAPVVPVYPLMPGLLGGRPDRFCVYQDAGFAVERHGEGIVLPCPRTRTIRKLATGSLPARSRWIRAWRTVWEYPWS